MMSPIECLIFITVSSVFGFVLGRLNSDMFWRTEIVRLTKAVTLLAHGKDRDDANWWKTGYEEENEEDKLDAN